MDKLDIGIRVYTPIAQSEYNGDNTPIFWPEYVLIFDTETTSDEHQLLNFGSYRIAKWTNNKLTIVEEGFIYADDLPERCPEGYAILQEYVATHTSEAINRTSNEIKLYSRHGFIKEVFFKLAYDARAMVVGFNLPFDLARLSFKTSKAETPKYKDGFSLALATYVDKKTGVFRENKYRSRIGIKSIDSKKAFIGFINPAMRNDIHRKPKHFDGYFLDLHTLLFALTNRNYSLDSACKAYNIANQKYTVVEHGLITPDYIAYARQDTKITAELLVALRYEYDKHPINIPPYKAFSPASMGKAYIKAMGVSPRLALQPDFPNDIIGYAMASYYGGRTECHIRNTVVPVVYCDFVSMYTTVNGLLGLWNLIIADTLNVVEDTDDVRTFVEAITLEDCFNKDIWKQCNVLVQVIPDDDIFPVRAHYDNNDNSTLNIGVNYLTSDTPFWYALPDVIASKLLTGKTPQIVKAYRLVPEGIQSGLTNVKLAGSIDINPSERDFFLSVIEQRKLVKKNNDLPADERDRIQYFLKIFASATAYGIYAEMNRKEHTKQNTKIVCYQDTEPFTTDIATPEVPGLFSFPPIATLITSGAKLMLALLEQCVTDMGGNYALCDTDSMAIVATKDGGTYPCITKDGDNIKALSWSQVEDIRQKFIQLNPYDINAVSGSILDFSDVNKDSNGSQRQLYAYSVSTKRYALFTVEDNVSTLVEYKEHGLGHIFNPLSDDNKDSKPQHDWRASVWHYVLKHKGVHITHVEIDKNGIRVTVPMNTDISWFKYPAVQRITASTPERAQKLNVLPFTFVLTAHLSGFRPEKDKKVALIAPYQKDAKKWLNMKWLNIYDNKKYYLDNGDGLREGVGVRANSFLIDTVNRNIGSYGKHPEVKSLSSDGSSCTYGTEGLLYRRYITPNKRIYIGKESNKIEERNNARVVHDLSEVQNEYIPHLCVICGKDIGTRYKNANTCSQAHKKALQRRKK